MLGGTLFGHPVVKVTDFPDVQEVLIENAQGRQQRVTYEQLHRMEPHLVRHL